MPTVFYLPRKIDGKMIAFETYSDKQLNLFENFRIVSSENTNPYYKLMILLSGNSDCCSQSVKHSY